MGLNPALCQSKTNIKYFSLTTKGRQTRELVAPISNFHQKKKNLIEQLRQRQALREVVGEENECLGPQNHMSKAAKVKFIAAASTLDNLWLQSFRDLSRDQFMQKTLLLSLQNNGRCKKNILADD